MTFASAANKDDVVLQEQVLHATVAATAQEALVSLNDRYIEGHLQTQQLILKDLKYAPQLMTPGSPCLSNMTVSHSQPITCKACSVLCSLICSCVELTAAV